MKKITLFVVASLVLCSAAFASESKVICSVNGIYLNLGGDAVSSQRLESPINRQIQEAQKDGYTIVSAPSVSFTPLYDFPRDKWASTAVCVTVTKP